MWQEATDKHDWDLRMAPYAAMVDRMDQGIGRILSHIKQSGEENNTLVVFSFRQRRLLTVAAPQPQEQSARGTGGIEHRL